MVSVDEELFDKRIIVISSQIESGMAANVMSQMLAMDNDSHKPIKLYINSPGGEVSAGFQIIDTMNSIKSPVHTINTASCASMGAVILSSGTKRMSLPHARVMIHQVSAGTEGNIQNMRASLAETERVNQTTMSFLAENCGKTTDELIEMTHVDKWMDAKEAIEFGITDEIVGKESRSVEEPKETKIAA